MKYVLDTTALSGLMAGNPGLTARLATTRKLDVAVPQPVLTEIAYGIARLPASRRRRWLDARFAIFAAELPRVAWTDEVSQSFGAIKAALERTGRMIEDFDIAIAAHAVATHATLVTSNQAHMGRVAGLSLEDWSKPSSGG